MSSVNEIRRISPKNKEIDVRFGNSTFPLHDKAPHIFAKKNIYKYKKIDPIYRREIDKLSLTQGETHYRGQARNNI